MSTTAKGKPKLTAMMAARDRTMRELDNLDGQMRRAAEAETRAATILPPTFGRHATNWTRLHEAHYRGMLAAITIQRANESGGLRAKLMRQCDAIRAEIIRGHSKIPAPIAVEGTPVLPRRKSRS